MSALGDACAKLAAEIGPDAAIEVEAQYLDIVAPGLALGGVLRDVWRQLKQELMAAGPRAAVLSGAAHELEYYGGQR